MERLIKLNASVRQAPVGSNLLLLLDICLPKVTGVCVCGVCVWVCVCVWWRLHLPNGQRELAHFWSWLFLVVVLPQAVLHLRTSIWIVEPSKLKALWKAERQNRSLFG